MGDKQVIAKLDEDGELWAEFDEFKQNYRTQSEALREVMRRGLEVGEHAPTADQPSRDVDQSRAAQSYSQRALSRASMNIEHYAAFGMISAILAFVASDFVLVAASIGFAVIGISAAVGGMIVRILDYLERRPAVSPVDEVAEDA